MSSLWVGEDHLVYVRGSGFLMPFTEEYKRYRYRDIQTLSVARTSRIGMSILFVMGMLFFSGLATLTILLSDASDFGLGKAVFLSVLCIGGLVCAAFLLRHLILGPTCVCDIQTNLSRDRIRPLNRFPRTVQTIEQIEAKIRESQASTVSSADQVDGEFSAKSVESSLMDSFQIPKPVAANFVSFGILGLGCLLAIHLESSVVTALILVCLLGQSMMLTLSLIASVRKATPEAIRSTLWIQLGLFFLLIGSGAVYFLLVATRDPAYTIGITGPLEAYAAIATEGGLPGYITFMALAIGMVISSLVGVTLVNSWKARISQVNIVSEIGTSKLEEAEDG